MWKVIPGFTGKFVVLLMLSAFTWAQYPTFKAGEYPAPRYPELPDKITVEHLMPVARAVVGRKDLKYRYYPGFDVKKGQRVLIVATADYDSLVLEAVKKAINEKGARVDIMLGNAELPSIRKDPDFMSEGSLEVDWYTFPEHAIMLGCGGIPASDQLKIAMNVGYDVILSCTGGGWPTHPEDKLHWVYFPWEWADKFLLNANNINPELLMFIDKKAMELLHTAVSMHATDPEGTDLKWKWSPPPMLESIKGKTRNIYVGHHMLANGSEKASGVIIGTWNDVGPFPRMKVTLKDGRVTKMEGGGKYAKKWKESIEKWKDVTWPFKPGPGLFQYLEEGAYSTNPRSVMPVEAVDFARANAWDRTRSGMVHWGIGGGSGENLASMAALNPHTQFMREHPEIPGGHYHIHNYFTTIEMVDKNGKKKKLIDKGRLTVLDDPEVRREAAKYGDPDKILTEAWIPAIPGINVKGSYEKYSKNPGQYFREYFESVRKNN